MEKEVPCQAETPPPISPLPRSWAIKIGEGDLDWGRWPFFVSGLFLLTLIPFGIFYKFQQCRKENERGDHQETDADGEELAHTGHATVR